MTQFEFVSVAASVGGREHDRSEARHRIFFALYGATLFSVPFRQFAVLGDALAPITGAPAVSVPLMMGGLLIPLIGIVATSERIHAFLVVIASGLWLFNFARL